jgi:rubrerythrin
LIERALSQDADLTVRPESARKLAPAPTHWTCTECQHSSDLDVEDCPSCDHGTRPDS